MKYIKVQKLQGLIGPTRAIEMASGPASPPLRDSEARPGQELTREEGLSGRGLGLELLRQTSEQERESLAFSPQKTCADPAKGLEGIPVDRALPPPLDRGALQIQRSAALTEGGDGPTCQAGGGAMMEGGRGPAEGRAA